MLWSTYWPWILTLLLGSMLKQRSAYQSFTALGALTSDSHRLGITEGSPAESSLCALTRAPSHLIPLTFLLCLCLLLCLPEPLMAVSHPLATGLQSTARPKSLKGQPSRHAQMFGSVGWKSGQTKLKNVVTYIKYGHLTSWHDRKPLMHIVH